MYAVIRTGGKQYRVAENDVIQVEKLSVEKGSGVEFTDVMMIGDGGKTTVGAPLVAGAKVIADVVDQVRAAKVLVFKKKRRKNYRRLHGHRQDLTVLRITDILPDGRRKAAKKAAKPKPEAAPVAEETEAPAVRPEAPAAVVPEAAAEAEAPASETKKAKSKARKASVAKLKTAKGESTTRAEASAKRGTKAKPTKERSEEKD